VATELDRPCGLSEALPRAAAVLIKSAKDSGNPPYVDESDRTVNTAGAKGGPDANDLTALGWGPPNEIGLREAHHCDVGNCSDCRDLQCPGVRQQWLGWRQEGTSHAVSHGRRGKGSRCSMEDQWSLSQDGDCRRVRDGARRCSANASTESSQSRWSATFAMTESQLGFARLRANPDSKEAIEFYRRLGMCVANWAKADSDHIET
jgi:hypothetical protein